MRLGRPLHPHERLLGSDRQARVVSILAYGALLVVLALVLTILVRALTG